MNFRLLFIVLLIIERANGQLLPVDVHNAGLGNAAVSMCDSLSLQVNPAANIANRRTLISLAVSDPYRVKELMNQAFGLSFRMNEHNNGFAGVQRLGNASYGELNVFAGIAKSLGAKIAAGIRIHYQQWTYGDEHYRDEQTVYPSAGLCIRFNKNILFGCRIENAKSFFGRTRTRQRTLSSLINSGIALNIAPGVTLAGAIELSNDRNASAHLGAEYRTGDLAVRCGILSAPLRPSFGMGFRLKRYAISAALSPHPVLGTAGSAGITFII